MALAPGTPRISVNKLGEYLDAAGPGRRHRILHDAKFPSDYIRPFYRTATEVISSFIAGGMSDIAALENAMASLGNESPNTVWDQRRINSNIDALETFGNMIDAIDLRGAQAELGPHQSDHLVRQGVSVSVRPEVILRSTRRGQAVIGALKLHFPKQNPLGAQASGYVSAAMVAHLQATQELPVEPTLCAVVDVSSGQFFAGPNATRQRLRTVDDGCAEIASRWPTIQP